MTQEPTNVRAASSLAPLSASFALSAAIVVIFNTALACVKDADRPLLTLMNRVGYHNRITQGVLDLILFFALGFFFSKSRFATSAPSGRINSFLVFAVVFSGTALLIWYCIF